MKERTREARTVTTDPFSICQDGTDKGSPDVEGKRLSLPNWRSCYGGGRPMLCGDRLTDCCALLVSAPIFDPTDFCHLRRRSNLLICLIAIFGLNDFVVLFCFNSVSCNCGLWYADCRALCPGSSSQKIAQQQGGKKKALTFSTKFFRTDLQEWIPAGQSKTLTHTRPIDWLD